MRWCCCMALKPATARMLRLRRRIPDSIGTERHQHVRSLISTPSNSHNEGGGMSRTSLGIAGIVLIALLAFPGVARASIIDVIWKMSGPQLVGAVLHCEFDPVSASSPDYTRSECRVLDYRFTGALKERKERPWWLSLDLGAYTSTGRNSEDLDFKKFEDNMV